MPNFTHHTPGNASKDYPNTLVDGEVIAEKVVVDKASIEMIFDEAAFDEADDKCALGAGERVYTIALERDTRGHFAPFQLTLKKSQITCLVGESGCGKTTLLRLLCGLDAYKATQNFTVSDVAYMSQLPNLLPWLSVIDNLCLAEKLTNGPCQMTEALALLTRVGLSHIAHNYPNTLSVGMQQRVCLLRTFLQKKPIVLLDEPFSALDHDTRIDLQSMLVDLLSDTTVLLVTHDWLDVMRLAQNVYVIKGWPAVVALMHVNLPAATVPRRVEFDDLFLGASFAADSESSSFPAVSSQPSSAPSPLPSPPSLRGDNADAAIRVRTGLDCHAFSGLVMTMLTVMFSLILWHFACTYFAIPEYLLPSPIVIGRTFYANANLLSMHAVYTGVEVVAGILLAVFFALMCGVIYTFWPRFERILRPVLVVMQTMPSFLFMPFLLLWFGFGLLPKMIIVTLTGFFPITLAFIEGLKRPPSALLELESLFCATSFRAFIYLRLPAALPAFFTGLRWACLQGSVAVIAADWLGASHGLGYLILTSYSRLQIPLLFCCVIILIVFAHILMRAAKWAEQRCVFWEKIV